MRLPLPEEPGSSRQINIVPMIDVIFAILTFFILSSLYLTRSEGLPVNLPQATTGEAQAQRQLVVTIDPQGTLFVDRQAIQIDALASALRTQVEAGGAPLVVINADSAVPHGRVVAVMDVARSIPGVKLAIATQRP